MEDVKIIKNPKGYFSLFVNGEFRGNYDTISEAILEYEEERNE